jgi:NAD(P)-dependent dehydrogenase (short-subunit alcohol dehydrogenase family)
MNIENKVVFITGAGRGIGKALVKACLQHNAKKVYAGARDLEALKDLTDARVVPVKLDITKVADVQSAAKTAGDVQVLINNAGIFASHSLLDSPMENIRTDMEVNFFGTIAMIKAFAPVIENNGGGVIASISSILGLASMVFAAGYSASKAALFSATQALRTELRTKNIAVHGIFPGPIDTDMAKGVEMAKTTPEQAAENILQGIQAGHPDIFPDPMSEQMAALWHQNPKKLEEQFANF